jgi:hypothetical protein
MHGIAIVDHVVIVAGGCNAGDAWRNADGREQTRTN